MAKKTSSSNDAPAGRPEIEDWEMRLENARAKGGKAVKSGARTSAAGKRAGNFYESKIGEGPKSDTSRPQPTVDKSAPKMVSVNDVLQTANLTDRMEMARLRHSQVLAMRGGKSEKKPDSVPKADLRQRKETFRVALGGGSSDQADPVAPLETPEQHEFTESSDEILPPAAVIEEPKKRRAGGLLLVAGLFGLAIAAGFSGTVRDFLNGIVGNPISTQAALPSSDITEQPAVSNEPPLTKDQGNLAAISPEIGAPEIFSGLGQGLAVPVINPEIVPATMTVAFRASGFSGAPGQNIGTPTKEGSPNASLGDQVPVYSHLSNSTQPPVGAQVSQVISLSGSSDEAPQVMGEMSTATPLQLSESPAPDIRSPIRVATLGDVNGFAQLLGISTRPESAPQLPASVRISSVQVTVASEFSDDAANFLPADVGINFASLQSPNPFQMPSKPVLPNDQEMYERLGAPPDALPVSPAVLFQFSNLAVHAPTGLKDSDVDIIVTAFRDAGFEIGAPKRVGFTISKTNVRFFHTEDADGARALAEIVGGVARDFTDFRPSPPNGTVEVWLAGKSSARSTTRSGSNGTTSMQRLRDRLVESLRRGDHL